MHRLGGEKRREVLPVLESVRELCDEKMDQNIHNGRGRQLVEAGQRPLADGAVVSALLSGDHAGLSPKVRKNRW